ncbi:MAG: hypothetical protein LBL95_02545 [Deltaproteobacteria bacterium]|nr:hypothetical protein [Deltaproteobacteria bacterium]
MAAGMALGPVWSASRGTSRGTGHLGGKGLRPGMTLVELIVVLLVGLLVTGLAFTVFRSSTSHFVSEDASLRMNQNLRAALATLARDVRMAGNGLSILGPDCGLVQFYGPTRQALAGQKLAISKTAGWFRHPDAGVGQSGVRAIYGVDGGNDGPDAITVFRSEIERPSAIAQAIGYQRGAIRLDGPVEAGSVGPGDVVALVNADAVAIFEAGQVVAGLHELPIRLNGRFTHDGPPAGFPVAGSRVLNLRQASVATYFLDEANSRLMADYHDQTLGRFDDPAMGAMILAEDVEDFQAYFYFDGDPVRIADAAGDPAVSSARFAKNRVKAVALGLSARSASPGRQGGYRRPALFNRQAGTSADHRRHANLVEIVYLRNFYQ